MADAGDLKSPVLTDVRVRIPPRLMTSVLKTKGLSIGHVQGFGNQSCARKKPGCATKRGEAPSDGDRTVSEPRRDRNGLGQEHLSIGSNILQAIGNTSLIRLRRVVPPGCAKVFVKLEWENPTGSMKDRSAQAMISRAEEDGRLSPGDTIIEYSGGSTGASLALVCAAQGYHLHIVTSDVFSRDKRDQMSAFGAALSLVPSHGGLTTKALILDMIAAAKELSKNPHTYWTDQLNNFDSMAGYHPLAEEIWSQTDGKVDAFVHCVGTAASLRGVATVLKRFKSNLRIVAVEPAESAVLSGGEAGPHNIEGVGIGYTPPLWDASLVDELMSVKTADAKAMARRLAREEALFAGTSSGANVIAAIRVAEQLGPDARVVTLMADSGMKYLSTDVYSNERA